MTSRPASHSFTFINQNQVVYEPVSRLSAPTGAAVPFSMADETRSALLRLQARVGDIDAWLCERLRWTREEASRYLTAEQADGVALCLDAAASGSGTIVADATGFGKGRILAATMRAVILDGRVGIFFTEKDALFSDFWRDIGDIGSEDVFGRPFIVNDDVSIVHDVTGKTLFSPWKKSEAKAVIATQQLPANVRLVMSTYSQCNKSGRKPSFLKKVGEGAHVVLDEAHNFNTITSATSTNVSSIIAAGASSTYSSATFARHIDNLVSFSSVFPWLGRIDDLDTMSIAARRALAEESSRIACGLGRVIRREHDLTNVRLNVVVDETRTDRNAAFAEALAPALSAMAALSDRIDEVIEARNAENEERLAALAAEERKDARETWSSGNFGARMNVLVSAFVTAILVDQTVEKCLKSLGEGQKPVVVLDATMEALMRELQGVDGDAEDEDADQDPNDRPPSFHDSLRVTMARIRDVGVRRAGAPREVVTLTELDVPGLTELCQTVEAAVVAFPDLSLSPLDDIREKVEQASAVMAGRGEIDRPYRMGEISGRSLRVVEGRYAPVPKVNRTQIVASFNSGELDGLILTRSGSTGISLHASPKTADKRRRHMMEVCIPQNPNERIQMLGRVSRRGMVNEPEYSTLCTSLPFNIYQLAVQNTKMAEASACVTASEENGLRLDVPDLLNLTGNDVAYEILSHNQDMARRLKVFMGKDRTEADRELYFVRTVLKRMPMLAVREQLALFDAIESTYRVRIKHATAKQSGILDGEWTLVGSTVIEAGNQSDDVLDGGDVQVQTVEQRRDVHPLRRADVMVLMQPLPDLTPWKGKIMQHWPGLLERALANKTVSTVEEALTARYDNGVKRMQRRLERARSFIDNVQPGFGAMMPDDEGFPAQAIITGLQLPPVQRASVFREYELSYVIPGEETERHVSLETVLRDGSKFGLKPESAEDALRACDDAPEGIVPFRRIVLGGNMLRAVLLSERIGTVNAIRLTCDGVMTRGLLVPKRLERELATVQGRVCEAGVAKRVLLAGGHIRSRNANPDDQVTLSNGSGQLLVRLPRGKRFMKRYLTEELTTILGSDPEPFTRLSMNAAEGVLRAVGNVTALYYDASMRGAALASPSKTSSGPARKSA